MAWRATGLALTSPTCDRDSVPAAKRIAYSYDARNRLLATNYGDASPGITRSYDAAGNLATINSNGTAWTYGYTALNQPRTETLGYGAQVNTVTWGYNPNGHVSSLGYPDGTVSYALNALGEITAIGGYASGISYHPNGAVYGYTLANGVVHSLSLNTRGLPLIYRDAGMMQDR